MIGTLTAPLELNWLTSGRTRRLSRSGDSTVGTTARLTPNCLNSTVIVGDPLLLLAEIGTGNSPPARKLAVSPDCAVRFGSARIVMSWSAASASTMPFTSHLPEVNPAPIWFGGTGAFMNGDSPSGSAGLMIEAGTPLVPGIFSVVLATAPAPVSSPNRQPFAPITCQLNPKLPRQRPVDLRDRAPAR